MSRARPRRSRVGGGARAWGRWHRGRWHCRYGHCIGRNGRWGLRRCGRRRMPRCGQSSRRFASVRGRPLHAVAEQQWRQRRRRSPSCKRHGQQRDDQQRGRPASARGRRRRLAQQQQARTLMLQRRDRSGRSSQQRTQGAQIARELDTRVATIQVALGRRNLRRPQSPIEHGLDERRSIAIRALHRTLPGTRARS